MSGKFGFDHVSFGVEEEEDLWELKDSLMLRVSGYLKSSTGFIHSIYSYDPNNIPIEFSHNVEGTDIRKEPRIGDRQPTKAALEGSQPQDKWQKVKHPTPPEERIVYPGVGSEIFHGYIKN